MTQIRMKRAFFITGTDTEVGKTYVSCALLHAMRREGLSAIGMKPIAAGVDASGRNEDVVALMAASSVEAPYELINPYCFDDPIAPHIAAAEAGRHIEAGPIVAALTELEQQAEGIVVEGVGGFLVPLGEDFDAADLAQALALPVILVVGMRLGCLNHALLTQEAIRTRGLKLAGWVANRIDPGMLRFDENLAALRMRLDAPLLGIVPYDSRKNAQAAAASLSLAA